MDRQLCRYVFAFLNCSASAKTTIGGFTEFLVHYYVKLHKIITNQGHIL